LPLPDMVRIFREEVTRLSSPASPK
jgi:hypothetical protein